STDDLVVITPSFSGPVFSADSADAERTRVRRERQREVLLQIPGVEAVAFGVPVPAGQVSATFSFRLSPPDRPDREIRVALASADRVFPEMLDLRVLHGRWPDVGDASGHVVSRALAEAVFGHVDVVGEVLPSIQGPGLSEPKPVVAVVENVFFAHPEKPDDPRIYSESTFFSDNDRILLKTRLPLGTLRPELDRLIEAGDLEIDIAHFFRPRDRFRELLAPDRGRLYLSMLAAATALALALFGFYGIQRFLVDAGRREFAILAAIGAGPKRLRRRVIGTGLLLGLPGLVFAGPLGYLGLAALKPEFLPDSTPALAIVLFVVVALAVLLVLTSLAPARRAAAIAPAAQLRED
ncbi:MAG: FtsX-like permease family protein, partial [Wenzhouxiangellaceae bacterium]